MERYQVILAYDGTDFHGSQVQTETRTVQGVVEVALRKLNWTGKSILIAGRTDAGVHASGQVAAFDLDWSHSPTDLKNALNALLPHDVVISDISTSRSDFHPRYDAVARSYRYRIYCQPVRDPIRERHAWRVWPAPDFGLLQSASLVTCGIHDYRGFGRATSPGGSTIRNVMKAEWLPGAGRYAGDELDFEITANAFLYHMVRRLVYAHIAVGQGILDLEDLKPHLQNPESELVQGLAPPQGLSLVKVSYTALNDENRLK